MIRIVFMGTPLFSVPVLKRLIEDDFYQIVGVVSQPDKKVGRKQVLTPSPVSCCALEHHLPLYRIEKIKSDYSEILALQPDLIITCAYGQMIPEELLTAPKYGCINVHASLLPKFRGGAPIQKAIMTGEEETGITIMYMDQAMDSGDIIAQERLKIEDQDNLESLTHKLSLLGRDLLIKTLPHILQGNSVRIKQDPKRVTFAYNITHEEEHVLFKKPAREVFNQVRALSPEPGCFVLFHGRTIKIYDGYISTDRKNGEASTIARLYKDGIGVNTEDFIYVITEIKLEGKKKMAVRDYLNGCKEQLVGERYE